MTQIKYLADVAAMPMWQNLADVAMRWRAAGARNAASARDYQQKGEDDPSRQARACLPARAGRACCRARLGLVNGGLSLETLIFTRETLKVAVLESCSTSTCEHWHSY